MRILIVGNNWVGWQVTRWLREQGEMIVGLVLHPPSSRTYGEEIIRSAGTNPTCIFDGSLLRQEETLGKIRSLRADIALSLLFDFILQPRFLELFPAGVINLHPAYLPYNRGQYPNVWSIVERTPAGVTLHYVDSGIDTGDIIAQREVPIEPVDTGESLYRRLEQASVDLFIDTWPLIRAGKARGVPQRGEGTAHCRRDVNRIDEIDLNRSYPARQLIDTIRARTFSSYPGAYVVHNEEKIYLRLSLLREQDL